MPCAPAVRGLPRGLVIRTSGRTIVTGSKSPVGSNPQLRHDPVPVGLGPRDPFRGDSDRVSGRRAGQGSIRMVSRSRLYTKPLGPRRATGAQDRGPERRTSTLVITPPAGVKGVTRAGTPFVVLHLQILQTQAKSIRAACLVVVCSPRRSSRHPPPLLQAFLRPAHPFGVRTRTPPLYSSIWFSLPAML